MGNLKQIKEQTHIATHLLLVGHTKAGKSRYIAEAARAGYEIFYIDADNGLATLVEALKDDESAMDRVTYLQPANIASFLKQFLIAPKLDFNATQGKKFASISANDGDEIWTIVPSLFPSHAILCVDSWTSVANSAMESRAKKLGLDLSDPSIDRRAIYNGAGNLLTAIMQLFQVMPFDIITLAHPTLYEQKVKPTGIVSDIKEKDMRIKATTLVPISSSNPHGYTMGKYFNQIGWLSVSEAGDRILDFEVEANRMGGGTPNKKGNMLKSMSYANLFGSGLKDKPTTPPTWLTTRIHTK